MVVIMSKLSMSVLYSRICVNTMETLRTGKHTDEKRKCEVRKEAAVGSSEGGGSEEGECGDI